MQASRPVLCSVTMCRILQPHSSKTLCQPPGLCIHFQVAPKQSAKQPAGRALSGAHGSQAARCGADSSERRRSPESGHHSVVAAPVKGRRMAALAAEGAELAQRPRRAVCASRVAGSGAASLRQRCHLARGWARSTRWKNRRRQAAARRRGQHRARQCARRSAWERHTRWPRHACHGRGLDRRHGP